MPGESTRGCSGARKDWGSMLRTSSPSPLTRCVIIERCQGYRRTVSLGGGECSTERGAWQILVARCIGRSIFKRCINSGVSPMKTQLSIASETRNGHSTKHRIPRRHQVVLGPKLGEGEYSSVYEVESFSLCRPEDIAVGDEDDASSHPPPSEDEMGQRLQMKRMETYRTSGKARYALKHIKDHKDDMNKYVQAAG
jgi:hypothetical protein